MPFGWHLLLSPPAQWLLQGDLVEKILGVRGAIPVNANTVDLLVPPPPWPGHHFVVKTSFVRLALLKCCHQRRPFGQYGTGTRSPLWLNSGPITLLLQGQR